MRAAAEAPTTWSTPISERCGGRSRPRSTTLQALKKWRRSEEGREVEHPKKCDEESKHHPDECMQSVGTDQKSCKSCLCHGSHAPLNFYRPYLTRRISEPAQPESGVMASHRALVARGGRRSLRAGARAHLLETVARQLIRPLVEDVAGVTLDPMPAHAMLRQSCIEPLPEIDILDRFLVGGAPAVALPLIYP